jgi:hypothetical protein
MTYTAQQKTQNTANDSIFGLLAASMLGPAFGAPVGDIWQSAEIASEIYTDRHQAAAKKTGSFELGARHSLAPVFGGSVLNTPRPEPQPAMDNASALYYHKLAAFEKNRRYAPRLAA